MLNQAMDKSAVYLSQASLVQILLDTQIHAVRAIQEDVVVCSDSMFVHARKDIWR